MTIATGKSSVNELRRLNDWELKTIIEALTDLADSKCANAGAATIMLEDDAEFVRGLFWTSKAGPQ
jgi:hypothetical protein